MRNRFTQAPGGNEEEGNSLSRSIVRSTLPRIGSVPTTNNQPNIQFQFNMMMGNMTDCIFYVPDVAGDSTGLAFCVAYNAVKSYGVISFGIQSYGVSNKDPCTYVGSMLCSVIPGFRNPIETALNGIGISPLFGSLSSQARENNILISNVPELDWSSILVVFGYCVLLLFKIDNSALFRNYVTITQRIDELHAKVGCSPSNNLLGIPFTNGKEDAIRTMLGTQAIHSTVIKFLMNNFDHPDPQICGLVHYLSYVLSWSGDLRVFTVMNERLVKTNSLVLSDYRVIAEVENLEETIEAIASHTYPQYFNHLCLVSELFYLDFSRFRTLFAVALELEKGGNGYNVFHYSEQISGADSTTVRELVKLHHTVMAQNRVTTGRRMPTVPGI